MNASDLTNGILSGSKAMLAKATTFSESSRPDHRTIAEEVLTGILGRTGNAIRLGVSGPPGVGKSTFIDAVGSHALNLGRKIAVLSIDPSSPLSGGSILGDKTRMNRLAQHENAFVRPSPSSGNLGGVKNRTREATLLCEAAGFDLIMVETVGVGQSDHAVASMSDFFILLHQPNSGDDLQGIKKGANELADLILVTKADGALSAFAEVAKTELEQALHFQNTRHEVFVRAISSKTGQGVPETFELIQAKWQNMSQDGQLFKKREAQVAAWLSDEIQIALSDKLNSCPSYHKDHAASLDKILKKRVIAPVAARALIDAYFKD